MNVSRTSYSGRSDFSGNDLHIIGLPVLNNESLIFVNGTEKSNTLPWSLILVISQISLNAQ